MECAALAGGTSVALRAWQVWFAFGHFRLWCLGRIIVGLRYFTASSTTYTASPQCKDEGTAGRKDWCWNLGTWRPAHLWNPRNLATWHTGGLRIAVAIPREGSDGVLPQESGDTLERAALCPLRCLGGVDSIGD